MIFQRLRLVAPVVVSLLAVTLAGCSGGSGGGAKLSKQDPLSTVAQAMQGQSGHITGTIDAPNAKPTALTGIWKGDLNGEFQTDATFTTKKGVALPTQMRLVDKKLYYRRSVAVVGNEPSLSFFARTSQFKPWRDARLGGIVDVLPSAFSPAATVQWLQRLHASVRVKSGEKVGDVKATRITTTRPVALGVWVGATVDVWVDGKARVIQVQIASPTGGARYAVTEYGADVSVQPPPSSEMENRSELPAREPAGPFESVRSGTTRGVTWSLERAPGTAGTECWRWNATPPLPEAGLKRPGDPRCVDLVKPDTAPEDTPTFAVIGNGTGSYDAFAIELPKGASNATLGFVGGKIMPVSAQSPIVWVGPADPLPGYFGVTLADGTKLDCGAGAISTPADLSDPSVNQNVSGAAWGCLQRDS